MGPTSGLGVVRSSLLGGAGDGGSSIVFRISMADSRDNAMENDSPYPGGLCHRCLRCFILVRLGFALAALRRCHVVARFLKFHAIGRNLHSVCYHCSAVPFWVPRSEASYGGHPDAQSNS